MGRSDSGEVVFLFVFFAEIFYLISIFFSKRGGGELEKF